MKDWKAAVRTWEAREGIDREKKGRTHVSLSFVVPIGGLLVHAEAAQERGEVLDKFWFEDRKWRRRERMSKDEQGKLSREQATNFGEPMPARPGGPTSDATGIQPMEAGCPRFTNVTAQTHFDNHLMISLQPWDNSCSAH